MLIVRLHEAIDEYQHRTGMRLTFEELAHRVGLAESTLRGIASGRNSTTLRTVEKIARELGMSALSLLEEIADDDRRAVDGRRERQAPHQRTERLKLVKPPKKKRAKGKASKKP